MKSKADVHIHSKYSDRPSEWILRRIGAPESFVEPLDLYKRCRERGMDFVTISDHNCIQGALDIAHLPDTFISCEVTTYFPEDEAKIHCLVLGIDENQFHAIQTLRSNIYEFRDYCREQNIICSVAHALFRVNERLSVDHLEKLILLFDRFEKINGTRDPRAANIVEAILTNLTPEMIDQLADKHDLAPIGPTPWKKKLTGGSDDHSGVYSASAYTETPKAETVEQYLQFLRDGDHEPGGASGNSLRLAHSLYHIAYGFYKSRFTSGAKGKPDLVHEMFKRMLEPAPAPRAPSLGDTLLGFAKTWVGAHQRKNLTPAEKTLVEECGQLFAAHKAEALASAAPRAADDRRSFQLACRVSEQLGYAFFREFVQYLQKGDLLASLQTLCSLGPVAMSVAPYLASFRTQHKDEKFCQEAAARFPAARHLEHKSQKRCWLTDTFTDVNGVARTIRTLARTAQAAGKEMTVVTCLDGAREEDFPIKNFKPVGSFSLPEYDQQVLSCPPALEMIEFLEREQFAELVISTPGPVGLTALAAGRLLGLRMTGIYHTDFPRYVGSLTEDLGLEGMAWRYMLWFYGQMDVVFAPSEAYRRELIEQGLEPARVQIMQRGVDRDLFTPKRRTEGFFTERGLPEGCVFLYVGRVSKEKGLDRLLESFKRIADEPQAASLAIVGEGPALEELRKSFNHPRIRFLGAMFGDELSRAYASADAFVFPSTTDTFGNAVLEAQAAGLPAVVANLGGPPEIVARRNSGIIVDLQQPTALADALRTLRDDPALRKTLSERALETAAEATWEQVLETLWRGASSQPARTRPRSGPQLDWATAAAVVGGA